MRIFYFTFEPPLNRSEPATGNQIRADFFCRGLEAAGMEVRHEWKHAEDGTGLETPTALAERIDLEKPEVILVGYWQLLEWLPETIDIPVIIDCVAPRPLEQAVAAPRAAHLFLERYLVALARADLILAGNRRQKILLGGWLLGLGPEAATTDLITLPLGCEPSTRPRTRGEGPLVLASGGRDWPWRRSESWHRALAEGLASEPCQIHLFGGEGTGGEIVRHHPMGPWDRWQRFLVTEAHVGLELADDNLEREASQSFRAMACLGAGLPLILNDYLELAGEVRHFDAGWIVRTPEDALAAAREASANPDLWERKAEGALQMAQEYTAERLLPPLLAWLERPRRRVRRPASPSAIAVRSAPVTVTGKLARALLWPFKRTVEGNGVVIITRSDLFPTDHGAAVKIIETARGLAACNRPVGIVTADRHRWYEVAGKRIKTRRLPAWLRWAAPPRVLAHLLVRLRGIPASNAFLYWATVDPFYGFRAAWVGRQIGANAYLAEFPGYAQGARIARLLNGGVAVLAEHNVEYLRLAEQLADLTPRQYRRLTTTELNLAGCMDAVVTVSDTDRRRLLDAGLDPVGILTIPHGVDLKHFEQTAPVDLQAAFGLAPELPVLAFHGTFSYPPNRQALELLASEILPRLETAGTPCQVLAIGREPPRALVHPHVHATGSLGDLAGPLKACVLGVVPLISGGGTRMKILDYFAAGLAVVSTSKGCEGLPVTDGEQLLIRNDWDGFATAIGELLEDPDRRAAIAGGGRALAAELDWGVIGRRYHALFERLHPDEPDS